MLIDSTLLGTFRSRFEAKEPDPRNFIRRTTKLDVYLTVHDIVEERRTKGFAWGGIAADFTELGVTMSVSTLKTCFRRARERNLGPNPRTKRPARRANTLRRGRSDASEVPAESATVPAEPPSPAVDDRPEQLAGDLPQSSAGTAPNPELPPQEPARKNEPVVALETDAELVAGELAPRSLDTTPPKTLGSREEGPLDDRGSSAEPRRDEAVHAAVAAAGDGTTVMDGASKAEPLRAQSLADARHGFGASSAAGSDDTALTKIEERSAAPTGEGGELAPVVGDGRSEMAATRATEPPRQNVSRLEALRARAPAGEKRRLAFVPRADDDEL